MENSINNCVRQQRVFSNHQIRTIHEEDDHDQEEESSWIFYFEDIDHQMVETEEDMSDYYDNDSSMISDAASPVRTTKINNVARKANNINTNPKKRRILHQHKEEEELQKQHKGEEEEDEEDTASSPSNKTKGFSVLDGDEGNTRNGKFIDNVTSKENICKRDTESKIKEIIDEEFSAKLKKRGLCVVPLSMLSNFVV